MIGITPVVASALMIGSLPVNGTVTFLIVDSRNRPLGVMAAGRFYGSGGLRATVQAGVLASGFTVPDLDLAVPVGPCFGSLAY